MNLLKQLDGILNQQVKAVAKITGDLGGGSFAAQTPGGRNLVLTGNASIGSQVIYDITSRRILGAAPDLQITDIPV
ncbi:hypothetical protein [Neisseria sp. S1]|uniref:hypothetical protein n=1 Tax=Neisseria sp. S1 TaxID=3318354 RepID=UPI003A8593FF